MRKLPLKLEGELVVSATFYELPHEIYFPRGGGTDLHWALLESAAARLSHQARAKVIRLHNRRRMGILATSGTPFYGIRNSLTKSVARF